LLRFDFDAAVAELGRVLINFGQRGSLNVRFAPKTTELLRRREMTRRANKRPSRNFYR
jgi:hypothetical protein